MGDRRGGLNFRVDDGVRADGFASMPVAVSRDGLLIAAVRLNRNDESAPGASATVHFGYPDGTRDDADHPLPPPARWIANIWFRPSPSRMEFSRVEIVATGDSSVTTDVLRAFKSEWVWGSARALELVSPTLESAKFVTDHEAGGVAARATRGRPSKPPEQMRTLAKTLLDPPRGAETLYVRVGRALGLSPETVRKHKARAVKEGWLQELSNRGTEPILAPGWRLKEEGDQ